MGRRDGMLKTLLPLVVWLMWELYLPKLQIQGGHHNLYSMQDVQATGIVQVKALN